MSIVLGLNDSGLKRKMALLGKTFKPRVLLRAIGLAQLQWIIANFDRDGALVGGWRPLSPNTIAGRRGGSSRPLQDSGRLKQSFVAGAPGNVFRVQGDVMVTVGTNVSYAEPHEEGVSPGAINPILPKRPGGVLTFMTANGRVFVRSVTRHPGIPRRRMLPSEVQGKEIAIRVIRAQIARLPRGTR